LIYAAEALVDYLGDTVGPLVRILFGPDSQTDSEEELKKKHNNYYDNVLPEKLIYLENFYQKHTEDGEYLVGKIMTIADFLWIEFYFNVFLAKERKDYAVGVLDKVPKLKKYFENRTEKDWKEYLAIRKPTTSGF